MQQDMLSSWTTMLGLTLILLGFALLVVPLVARYFADVEKVHPLLLIGWRLDGLYVGTSPILIIALLAVYLILRYFS
ncbi:MAG: hypothetical protein RMK31_02020 [Candidatus Caldarchaeum sp.]|nr:hypothetical protein [Candidatus Caldarchaeum sp.]MDW7978794.1 hypothetical protein [Candidatus Caldarchaeum sp.]MDW8359345.1 hypothetical protein [Candidatus Caldarchaeum sp.]